MKGLSLILQALSLGTLFVGSSSLALGVPSLTPSGVDAAFTRLFGEHKEFSADAVIRVYDKGEQETLSTTTGFAVRDTKVRMDVDMSKLKSKELPAGAMGGLRQLGMDKVVTLILPQKRASYVIYPGLEAVLKVPMDAEAVKVAASNFQLKRTAIGKETLDGHACIKYRVTVTDSSGAKQEATTWNAADLKDFPLQIQMADGDNMMILRFRNVQQTVPRAELFAWPAAYTQYDSHEALMQAVMMKALGGLGSLGGE